MPPKFTALPVGQGDAFLLERCGRTYLVDGGRSLHGFPGTLAAHAHTRRVNAMVCTHADADHVNGLIGLLDAACVTVDEVWLPGRWTDRLEDLCKNPAAFVEEAIRQADREGVDDLEEFGTKLASERYPPDADTPTLEHPEQESRGQGDMGEVGGLEEHLETATDGPWCGSRGLNPWSWPYIPPPLWSQVLRVAEKILALATKAHHAGAKLRWFDFDEANRLKKSSGGIPGEFEPVNAIELTSRYATWPSPRLVDTQQRAIVRKECPHGIEEQEEQEEQEAASRPSVVHRRVPC